MMNSEKTPITILKNPGVLKENINQPTNPSMKTKPKNIKVELNLDILVLELPCINIVAFLLFRQAAIVLFMGT
tara:strand:- start:339 stop:557 length:219 start_codon:yes stop_codon:yes gene_type:complete